MRMVQMWNGTERGKLKFWEKSIIKRGWLVDERVKNKGEMVLTGDK
jgi:hypothetical protein